MLNKIKILYYYFRTKYGFKFKNREELLNWQNKQVIKLLKKIMPKSPFYTEYFKNFSVIDWQKFPLIDKSLMMENFDNLNTAGIKKSEAFETAYNAEKLRDFSPTINNITVGLSSGTSGNRGIFLLSDEERFKWAGTILAKVLPCSIFSKHKIAFFLRANSNVYTTVNSNNINFEFFDLLNPLEQHLKRLNEFQPSVLVAPASMLRLLARAKEDKKLNVNPEKIISVAEVLDSLDESYIFKQFNQKIHQIYQCTEGFLASTCQYGTLHINEDMVVNQKEYLDKDLGKFIPIITDFSRTTQPIIRYRLNDILTEKKEPCLCGSVFTAIEKIEGRCDDIFYLPAIEGEKLIPVFPDFICRAIIYSSPEIEEYTAIQHSFDLTEIFLKSSCEDKNNLSNLVEKSLKELFEKLNCKAPELKINYNYDKLEKPCDKKLKRVKRVFNIEGE